VAGDDALVVEAHQLDDRADVLLVRDAARRRADLARKDRVIDNSAFVFQARCDVLGESEMRCMVAVQVAYLASGDGEGELAAAPSSRPDVRSGGDGLCDLLAWAKRVWHLPLAPRRGS